MPKRLGSDDDLPPQVEDWTTRAESEIPPWRREDRERLERVRSGSGGDLEPAAAIALAAELRRLTELYQEGAVTAQELVEAVKAALAEPA